MSKKVIISVIVTVHNAQKYLVECLDSVCGQTFEEIEILCIDGGSTDNSPQILKSYAEKDDRIRIINDTNTSYGHKINVGFAEAQGDYIAVLESDDLYRPNMLKSLYAIAEKYHPDFVNGEYRCFFDVEEERFYEPHRLYQRQPYNCLIENSAHPEEMELMDRFWTGIYSREFIEREKIRLNETPGASFQDMSFRFMASVLAKTVYHIDEVVYDYRIDNPGSSMKDPSKTVIIAEEHAYLKRELEKRGVTDAHIWKMDYYWKYRDMHANMRRLQGDGRLALYHRYLEELKKDLPTMEANGGSGFEYATREILEHADEYLEFMKGEFAKHTEYVNNKAQFYEMIHKTSQIIIFGCGQRGEALYHRLSNVIERLSAFADNSEKLWGSKFHGYEVFEPAKAVERYPDAFYMIANKYHWDEIKKQLLQLGVSEENIYVW